MIFYYNLFMFYTGLFCFFLNFWGKEFQKLMLKQVWIVFWTVFGMCWDEDFCCAVDNIALLLYWKCLWLLSSKRWRRYRNLLIHSKDKSSFFFKKPNLQKWQPVLWKYHLFLHIISSDGLNWWADSSVMIGFMLICF